MPTANIITIITIIMIVTIPPQWTLMKVSALVIECGFSTRKPTTAHLSFFEETAK